MAFSRICAAVLLVFAASAMVAAQPGKAPPVIQFKQFGSTPEQFQQAALSRWTGQLALELQGVKAEAAMAKVTLAARATINAQAEAAIRSALELDQLVRRGAAKNTIFTAFADVERSLTQLSAVINQYPGAKQATAGSMTRAEHAYHQLAAALGTGDTDPLRIKRRLVRLAEAIDDSTDDLRTLYADSIPAADRVMDRALGLYAREARLFARLARDEADAATIKASFEQMGQRWADAAGLLVRRQLTQPVQLQAARVDGLHRRMANVLNLPAYPPGTNPPILIPGKLISFAVGADAGAQPRVTVFADERGTVAYNFFAYDVKFDGGVRVDMADLNGDGIPDLIVAPGPSNNFNALPVRVYDGRDLNLLVEFVPFANWKGGVQAAGANLTREGRALVAVSADGTHHIKVFDLAQGKEIDSFFAHDQKATGGVRIAWSDVNGDGIPDLTTVNGPGNIPTVVKIFNGKNREVLAEFPVLDNKYRGGGFIASADLTGNGQANPVIGLDAGSTPLVRVFDLKGKVLAEWMAFDERFRGGVRVAVSANAHVVTAPGPGLKNSPLRIYHTGRLKNPPIEIIPFLGFDGGLNVGGR